EQGFEHRLRPWDWKGRRRKTPDDSSRSRATVIPHHLLRRPSWHHSALGASAAASAAGASADFFLPSLALSRGTNFFFSLGNSNGSPLAFWALPPASVIRAYAVREYLPACTLSFLLMAPGPRILTGSLVFLTSPASCSTALSIVAPSSNRSKSWRLTIWKRRSNCALLKPRLGSRR